MTTITLDEIKTQQTKCAEMIAAFEAQATAKAEYHFPEALIELAPGEHYAGLIIGKDGEASYHLVLMPYEANDVTWNQAVEWAKEVGGNLPTRREQALLYANLKEQFKPEWHWSGEQHASNSNYAWTQYFYYGYQNDSLKSSEGRARAVRRLPI